MRGGMFNYKTCVVKCLKKEILALSHHKKKISEKTNLVVLRNTVVHNVLNRLTCYLYNVNVSPHLTSYMCVLVGVCVHINI